jgi:hypothetical protein
MQVPGLGTVSKDDEYGWYRSAVLRVPVLKNSTCHLLLDGYNDDPVQEEFHSAISAFLALDESTVPAAAPWIFQYYRYVMADCDAGDAWFAEIAGPDPGVGPHPTSVARCSSSAMRPVTGGCTCRWSASATGSPSTGFRSSSGKAVR